MKFRMRLKVSTVEVAAMCGLPSHHIDKLEAGAIVPLEYDLQRIERALEQIEKNLLADAE